MFVLDTTRTGAQLYIAAPLSESVVMDHAPSELLVPVMLHYPSPHLPDTRGALSIERGGAFHRFLQSVPEAFLQQGPRVALNGSALAGAYEVIRDASQPDTVAVLLKIVTTDEYLDLDPNALLADTCYV